MRLPGVPQHGDQVVVLGGCEPCEVTSIEWILEPLRDDEEVVLVFLSELDADQFGTLTEAAEVLLDRGWRPVIE